MEEKKNFFWGNKLKTQKKRKRKKKLKKFFFMVEDKTAEKRMETKEGKEVKEICLTQEDCVELGRQIQMLTLMLHPKSELCHFDKAQKGFGPGSDIWVAFEYEAQFLLLHCGMNYKTLSMIRPDQIQYIAIDNDSKIRMERGPFDACCLKCKSKFRPGAQDKSKDASKTYILKNTLAGVQFKGFPFYTFNNIQLLCSEECWKKVEEELKQAAPKKVPPPPKPTNVDEQD